MKDWAPAQEALWLSPEELHTPSTAHASRDSGTIAAGPSNPNNTRARSMSAAPSWGAPQQTFAAHDKLADLSRRMDESAIDETAEVARSVRTSGRSRSHGHSSSGSIKSIFRRASLSLKGIVHRRPSVATEQIIYEERKPGSRPATARSPWHRLREAASFRHARSFYDADAAQDQFQTPPRDAHSSHLPVPGSGDEPPFIPRNSGAAAKASAAIQNEYLARQGSQNIWLPASFSEDSNDRESGIGISVTVPGASDEAADGEATHAQDAGISRIDFVRALPFELAIQVLSNLDAAALAKASAVSRGWQSIVSNQHIWRESCLRETTGAYATSGTVQPNAGQGIPKITPSNDWKHIYRVRNELAQRWRTGKARPVYLNGHMDSIYCLQFDE